MCRNLLRPLIQFAQLIWNYAPSGVLCKISKRSCGWEIIYKRGRIRATWVNAGARYNEVMMSTMTSQITSVSILYSTTCSGVDKKKHQSSTSLAFVRGIPHTKGQQRGKCFHLMTSSWRVRVVWWNRPIILQNLVLLSNNPFSAFLESLYHVVYESSGCNDNTRLAFL